MGDLGRSGNMWNSSLPKHATLPDNWCFTSATGKACESHSVMSNVLRPHGLYSPWNSSGQTTGVGSHSLLQGIFPTQGSNPGLPHCRQILYQLSHQGSPAILEWVAYHFSSGSSWPRNWTRVSCISGGFITNWAIKEALASLNHFAVQQKFINELHFNHTF